MQQTPGERKTKVGLHAIFLLGLGGTTISCLLLGWSLENESLLIAAAVGVLVLWIGARAAMWSLMGTGHGRNHHGQSIAPPWWWLLVPGPWLWILWTRRWRDRRRVGPAPTFWWLFLPTPLVLMESWDLGRQRSTRSRHAPHEAP